MTVIQMEIIFPNFQAVKRVDLKVQMRVIMRVTFQNRALTTDRQMFLPTTGFSKNDHEPRIPPFIGNPGVKFAVENEADVMSYFDHYIPPELIEIVVDQTNLYAQQQIEKMPRPVTKYARSEEWKPVTVIEMKKFLGLIFLTGIVPKPKLELYWSTREIFRTPIFSKTMSRNRFQLIQRYLHFNDNNAAGTNEDRLYKDDTDVHR